ncbi:MAG: alpha/beta fold hydrolase [Patescibacteria group bacterium]
MNNAIIIHGTCDRNEYFSDKYPSLSNSHWLPWLQKQLLMNNIFTQTPEMPEAYQPDYKKWQKEFERLEINEATILVGHSCGGGFLLRWLSENKVKIRKLVLVAPWIDPKRIKTKDFFNFQIDSSLLDRIKEIHLFISSDDDADIIESVKIITKVLPQIIIHNFSNQGYFTFKDMGTDKFPELLKLI